MPDKPSPEKDCARPSAPGSSIALTAVLKYASFASLWILLSDTIVSLLFSDPGKIALVSTLKGWLFVLITSLLLYFLIRRLLRTAGAQFSPVVSLRPLIAPVLLVAVVILALIWLSINHTLSQQQAKETARLQAIADLKTRQIADWMKERLGDARFVQSSVYFAETYYHWRVRNDSEARSRLINRLESYSRDRRFESVQLLDSQGETLWISGGHIPKTNPALKSAARKALAENKSSYIGPYRDDDGHLHIDFIAPLQEVKGLPRPVVVLHSNPEEYLSRTLQIWPVPSASGESVLFRRDGDNVLFLSDMRHTSEPALSLRFPISRENLPASMVLRGTAKPNQLITGEDYRGVPVIAIAHAIEGTDWFLIAKMDRAEIFAESSSDITWIALAGMLGLFITAAGGVLVRQRQHLLASIRDRQAQAEKIQALSLLDAIANNSTDAIFAKDLQGRYILFNRAAAVYTGTTPEAVLGQDDTVLFPAEQAALLMNNDRKVMSSNVAITFQENLATTKGQVSFLSTKGPLLNDAGVVIGMFGISHDISEQKMAEEALRSSEETYRSLFDNMLNGFAYCRMLYADGKPDDFIYLSVNSSFAELTGLKGVVGKKVSEVIPGIQETDRDLIATYGRVASTGVPERLEFYVEALQMWFWISVYSPKKDHFVAIFDVITERKRAEQALRESEARLHLALKSANMGVWEWDLRNDNVIWSPECYTILGVRVFGGTLRDFASFVHPEDSARLLDDARRAVQERNTYSAEFRVVRPDGSVLWVANVAQPNYDAVGNPLRMVGIIQDISRRKIAEEERNILHEQFMQSQKMESVGRLAGGIAHDFNNMLAVMFIAIELMRMKLSPADPLQEHLREMDGAATRARDITRQLLAFSRKQVIAPQVVDLNELIRGAEKTLARLIGEDIDLVVVPSPDLGRVKIDPSQFDQVLMNLVVNARDAMPNGGRITVETSNIAFDEEYCRMHADFQPGRYVEFTVSDNGVGMNEEVRSHIFEPFYTTKEVGKGTGLGLATIYGIVRQNQGFVTVYSEEGIGTTFRLFFPRVDDDVSRVDEPRQSARPGTGSILLVEDDELLCHVTQITLKQLGYAVTTAHSPAEALQIMRDNDTRFDLMLTDIVMPGMNGFELSGKIRSQVPDMKVLFMSGYTSDAFLQRGIVDQNVHFIQKPFSIDTLSEKLRAILNPK